MTTELCCWNCGAELATLVLPVSRRADCPECRAELHCCRMCRQFDPDRPEQCREDRAEPPTNKEVANFCDWFEPAVGLSGLLSPEDRARSRLDALFGGAAARAEVDVEDDASRSATPEEEGDSVAAARRRLDDLFE